MYSTCPTDVIVCTWSSSISPLPRLGSHILGMHWFLWMMGFLVLKSSCLFRSCNGTLGLWMNPHVRIPTYTHILYVICASLSVCLLLERGFSFQGGASHFRVGLSHIQGGAFHFRAGLLISGRGFPTFREGFQNQIATILFTPCGLFCEAHTFLQSHSFILTPIRYLISLLFFLAEIV